MLKSLWVSHFPVYGGPHNVALRLAAPLRAHGVGTTFLLPEEPGTAAQRLLDAGVPVIRIPLHRVRSTHDLRVHAAYVASARTEVRRLRTVIRHRGFDLVVLTGLLNPHAALAAHLENVPLVWQLLDTATPPPVREALMSLVRSWSDAVMFNGEGLREQHLAARPLRQPTAIFTGPVDTELFRPARASERRAMRAELGLPQAAPVVGTVANFNPMKGIEWFVRAAGRIFRRRPDAWFLLSGAAYDNHADYFSRLEREMEVSGVPRERFVVRHDPPERHYPVLDVKLITSLPASEGQTTTGPEAMACGIPVVATDIGAVREVIADGETGFVVAPLDADALAEATLTLLADEDLRARFGAVGRSRTLERYGLEPSAAVFLRCFEEAQDFHARR